MNTVQRALVTDEERTFPHGQAANDFEAQAEVFVCVPQKPFLTGHLRFLNLNPGR